VDGAASLIERWLIDRRKLSSYTFEEILSPSSAPRRSERT